MNKLFIAIFLVSVVSFSSCSKFFSSNKSTTNNTTNSTIPVVEDEIVTRELTVAGEDTKNSKSWGEIAEDVDNDKEFIEKYGYYNKSVEVGDISSSDSAHPTTPTQRATKTMDDIVLDLRQLKGEFHYPTNGHKLSGYGIRRGRMHSGVDIKANRGDNIYAAFDGVVRFSKYYSGYGNLIILRHYNGLETFYSHNTRNLVKIGQEVSAGDVIALAGRTGRATGDHLHFEVRANGQYFNPELLIDTQNRTIQDKILHITMRNGRIYASNTNIAPVVESKPEVKKEEKPKEVVKPAAPKEKKSTSKVHIIKKGDTLYSIALKNGTTVKEICRINGISSRSTLRIGQKIKLP